MDSTDLTAILTDAGGRDGRSEFEVPADRREEVRSSRTLAQCYREFVEPHRLRLSETKGKPTASTLAKERQAVRRWERWDLEQRPERLPAGVEWYGLPIRYVTGEYVERWVSDTVDQGGLSRATIASTWNHLRVVLNWLQSRSRLLETQPTPDVPGTLDRLCEDHGAALVHATYSLEDLGAVHHEIGRLDVPASVANQLQAAWVLSTCCGPRTADLFGLRWGEDVRLDGDEPEITYKARKTGKRHWCPLPTCVVTHLRNISVTTPRRAGRSVFTLGERRRNALIKDVIRAIDSERFDVDDRRSDFCKPWQVGRATAYTRADAVVDGAGRYLCHPPHSPKVKQSADVRANYLDWRPRLREAMVGMEQPAEFLGRLSRAA